MKHRTGSTVTRIGWLVACLLVSSWTSAAPPTPGARVAQASSAPSDGGMSLLMKGTADKDKRRFADEAADEMREGTATLQKKVEGARKDKDIVLLNCLNEKLSALSSLLKVTETASILMSEALGQNNTQQAEHQFRKIVIARFKARQLLQEANECVGGEGVEGSSDEASVTVDSALEGEQTTTDSILDPIDSGTPGDLPTQST